MVKPHTKHCSRPDPQLSRNHTGVILHLFLKTGGGKSLFIEKQTSLRKGRVRLCFFVVVVVI